MEAVSLPETVMGLEGDWSGIEGTKKKLELRSGFCGALQGERKRYRICEKSVGWMIGGLGRSENRSHGEWTGEIWRRDESDYEEAKKFGKRERKRRRWRESNGGQSSPLLVN